MNEDEYEKLVNGIKLFRKQAKERLLIEKLTVDRIVDNRINNKPSIIKTLDKLLNIIFSVGIGKIEYHKLNNFYSIICPKDAKEYREIYEKVCGKKY